eukprot:scaffold19416_cov70-Skeletonema_dohrnii-CCMP3373.AAC.1
MSSAKGLVVISGASRGIGRAIALALADATCVNNNNRDKASDESSSSILPSQHLHMVLMARSASSLQETADMVKQRCGNGDAIVTTTCHEMDLANIDNLPQNVKKILEPLANENYNSCLLINNAGSLGPLGK